MLTAIEEAEHRTALARAERDWLLEFARDVARLAPRPGDDPLHSKGVLSALSERARTLHESVTGEPLA